MSIAAQVVLADTSGAYWFAGILTLVAALIVMVVTLSEPREDKTL
jgi:hypothetical protein